MAVVLSVLPWFTTSDYPFGTLWPLYFPSFLDLRFLITPLVSCGHCIVSPSSIYDSDYLFGILWPLYFPSFLDLRFLITPLVTCSHCIVCPSSIYDFWLPLWYLVTIVLSVLPRFCIICPSSILYYLSFLDLRLLITPLASCGHCIVCHSSIYDFWLPFWYLVAIVLSVRPRFTTSDYPFCILWPLYCLSLLDLRLLITPLVSCGHCIVCHSSILYYLSFLDLRLLITPLVSFGHCVVCPSSIYDLWLPLWYLVAIVFSVLPRFTNYDYPFGILWPFYCLSFLDFVLSVIPRFTSSDYPFGIFWPLCCLYFLDIRLLITPLVTCRHCIGSPSSIYDFWLPLWYLVTIVLSVLPRFCIICHSSICDFWLPSWYLVAIVLSVRPRYTTSDYPFYNLWPLYCLSLLDLRLLITPLVSCGRCIVCPSSINEFWLPLWYLLAIVFSVVPGFTTYDYPFGIFWPLYCLSFFDLRLLVTALVSCGHCIVCPSSIYDFWLPFWYPVAIVLSVLPRYTTSDYPFGILWPLYCLSVLDLRLLIIPFVSCGHFIFFPSSIYDFWLPL